MKLKYYLKKKYNLFRFNLCANENPLYLFFYKYLYRPPKNSLSEFLDKYSFADDDDDDKKKKK